MFFLWYFLISFFFKRPRLTVCGISSSFFYIYKNMTPLDYYPGLITTTPGIDVFLTQEAIDRLNQTLNLQHLEPIFNVFRPFLEHVEWVDKLGLINLTQAPELDFSPFKHVLDKLEWKSPTVVLLEQLKSVRAEQLPLWYVNLVKLKVISVRLPNAMDPTILWPGETINPKYVNFTACYDGWSYFLDIYQDCWRKPKSVPTLKNKLDNMIYLVSAYTFGREFNMPNIHWRLPDKFLQLPDDILAKVRRLQNYQDSREMYLSPEQLQEMRAAIRVYIDEQLLVYRDATLIDFWDLYLLTLDWRQQVTCRIERRMAEDHEFKIIGKKVHALNDYFSSLRNKDLWYALFDAKVEAEAALLAARQYVPLANYDILKWTPIAFLAVATLLLTTVLTYKKWKSKLNMLKITFYLSKLTLYILFSLQLLILITIIDQNAFDLEIQKELLFVNCVMTFFTICVLTGSTRLYTSDQYEDTIPSYEHLIMLLTTLLAFMIMVLSTDLFTLYFGMELQALISFFLIASRTTCNRGIEGSLKYLLISGFGTALFLLGTSLLYGAQNTLELSALIEAYSGLDHHGLDETKQITMLNLGGFFVMVGLFLKLGIAPFHVWMPDIYEAGSHLIIGFLAVVPKMATLVVVANICFQLKEAHKLTTLVDTELTQLYIIFSFLSIFIGGVGAYAQTDFKRFLAYSSVAQVGYLFYGVIIFTSPVYVYLYLLHYGLVVTAIFVIASSMRDEEGSPALNNINQWPLVANHTLPAILGILLFSAAGLPPLFGFIPKLLILKETLVSGKLFLSIWIIFFTAISVYVYIKLFRKLIAEMHPHYAWLQARIDDEAAYLIVLFTTVIVEYILVPNGLVAYLIDSLFS